MCGIAGIMVIDPARRPASGYELADRWLGLAEAAIAHRGPDGRGIYRAASDAESGRVEVTLLHRRLAILDAAGGAQPMVRRAGAGEVAVVFNGCIYNHRDVRRDLAAAGGAFDTDHADTEVLAVGWGMKQERLLPDLDGMFAAAFWDSARNTLTLARDRAGEKPLWHTSGTLSDGRRIVAFASEIPALLSLRVLLGLPATLHPDALRTWIILGSSGTPPMNGIDAVGAGMLHEFRADGPRSPGPFASWWRPPEPAHRPGIGATETLAALERSVITRLDADVPLACFLSGGIDSPLIAALAKKHKPDLKTFTVRMPDARYDESGRAAMIARHLGTDHTTLACEPTPVADLELLIPQLGLPLGDSSLLPTTWVSRATREHVKVALTGDGADELFDGYERYRVPTLLRRWGWLLRLMPGMTGHPKSKRAKLGRLIDAAGRGTVQDGYLDVLSVFPVRHGARIGVGPPEVKPPEGMPDPAGWEFRTVFATDLLCKVDTAAMSVALETRAPYLSEEILRGRLGAVPENQGRKRILREAAASLLPREIVTAPKSGFSIPIGDWFRTDFGGLREHLRARVLDRSSFATIGPAMNLSRPGIEAMVAAHLSGAEDHSQRLYHLLVLAIWDSWVTRELQTVAR